MSLLASPSFDSCLIEDILYCRSFWRPLNESQSTVPFYKFCIPCKFYIYTTSNLFNSFDLNMVNFFSKFITKSGSVSVFGTALIVTYRRWSRSYRSFSTSKESASIAFFVFNSKIWLTSKGPPFSSLWPSITRIRELISSFNLMDSAFCYFLSSFILFPLASSVFIKTSIAA